MRAPFFVLLLMLASSSNAVAAGPPAKTKAGPKGAKLTRIAIPGCECSLLAPPGFKFRDVTEREDGTKVYSGAAMVSGTKEVGVVAIKFPERLDMDEETSRKFLEGVLAVVKPALGAAPGEVELGKRVWPSEHDPEAMGFADYWEPADEESEVEWAVRGWISPTHAAVVYIKLDGETYRDDTFNLSYFEGYRSDVKKPKKAVAAATPVPKAASSAAAQLKRVVLPNSDFNFRAPADLALNSETRTDGGGARYEGKGSLDGHKIGFVAERYPRPKSTDEEISQLMIADYLQTMRREMGCERMTIYEDGSPPKAQQWDCDGDTRMIVRAFHSTKGIAVLYVTRKDANRSTTAAHRDFLASFAFE